MRRAERQTADRDREKDGDRETRRGGGGWQKQQDRQRDINWLTDRMQTDRQTDTKTRRRCFCTLVYY